MHRTRAYRRHQQERVFNKTRRMLKATWRYTNITDEIVSRQMNNSVRCSCFMCTDKEKNISTLRRIPLDDESPVHRGSRRLHKPLVVRDYVFSLSDVPGYNQTYRGFGIHDKATKKLRCQLVRERNTKLRYYVNRDNVQISPEFSSKLNAVRWVCFEAFNRTLDNMLELTNDHYLWFTRRGNP